MINSSSFQEVFLSTPLSGHSREECCESTNQGVEETESHLFFFFFFNVYLFLRERQSISGGGAEREGDTDLKQDPGSELSGQSLT